MSEHRKSRLQAQEFKQCISMPAGYFQDTIRAQLASLMDENLLQDTLITLRASSMNMSSFVLSLVSPVLRKMVCGNFKESVSKRINLDDVENGCFSKLVRLACGVEGVTAENMDELLGIGALAERLQMDAIRGYAENMLLKQLNESTCVELLQGSEANGLKHLRTGCYKILRDNFQALADQEGFSRLSEETMGDLLEEDELGAEREEDIFDVLMRWMTRSGEGHRGSGLLRKIRFGVINDEYLANGMLRTLPRNEMLTNLVAEMLVKKLGGEMEVGWDGVERLCEKWMVSRRFDRVVGYGILRQPNYVAINSQGHLLVSDNQLHQVIVFDRDGSVLRRIGSQDRPADDLKFEFPGGVAVDRQDRVVVSDWGNHRIQLLNADGSQARCFGSEGTTVGKVRSPNGVAMDENGHIVVADCDNHRIQVFDADGSVVRHFGSKGTAVGQLILPRGVALDRVGRIVVVDSGNHRVQVFNGDGTAVLCFGSYGCGPGQLSNPRGVAVDREGRFVVADTANDRVQVFNPDGSVAYLVNAAESRAGLLCLPRGVAVSGSGRIVVVEGAGAAAGRCNTPRVRIL